MGSTAIWTHFPTCPTQSEQICPYLGQKVSNGLLSGYCSGLIRTIPVLQDLECDLEMVMALFMPTWFLISVENIWVVLKNLTGFELLLGLGYFLSF